MLGQTADSLYWMARYAERAENVARMLDVGPRMGLIPSSPEIQTSAWKSTLEIAGAYKGYRGLYGAVDQESVIRILSVDRENPSSIWSSLRAARENARGVRGTITTEMWEVVNGTWLEIRDIDEQVLLGTGYRKFFENVKDRANLFRGVTNSTMLQDDGYAFVRLGYALERAGNTARLLDAKYHVLLPSVEDVGGAVDYYQWGALLRSVSAFRAYHKIYSNVIAPSRVAELLIMRPDMPRSLLSCLNEACSALAVLCLGRPFECRRLAGELHANIAYGRMSDIFDRGLHEFLTEVVDDCIALGQQIQRDFMMLA